jgi:hypothetical protein
MQRGITMIRNTYLRFFSLICVLLITTPLFGEGCVAGTLVCTPQGYTPIEHLVVGDEIVTFDLNTVYTVEPIAAITVHEAQEFVRIKIQEWLQIIDFCCFIKKNGAFEYIIENDGFTCNHRLFKPKSVE